MLWQGLERHTRAWLRSRGPTQGPPKQGLPNQGPPLPASPGLPPSGPPSVEGDEVQALLSIQTEALLLAEAMQHLEQKLQQQGEWGPGVDEGHAD